MSVRGFNTGSGIEQYDYDYLDNKPAAPTKASIGLGNVDNTSDMDKPVSTAQGEALSNKVDKVPGMVLSSEDYTSADKAKLEALPTNEELEAELAGKASQSEVTSLNQAINVLDGQVNDTTTGLDTKAPAIINTASGAIASFADGADGMPVKKLVVAIEPQQDLHGYDHPWPAGSGKNILDIEGRTVSTWEQTTNTIRAEACSITKDGDVLTCVSTGPWSKVWLTIDTSTLVDGQTYTISAMFSKPSGGTVGVAWYDTAWHDTVLSTNTSVKLQTSFTYDTSKKQIVLGFIVNNTNEGTGHTVVVSEMQLENGSTATSYAPYSNICPISGWTGAEIEGTGVNLLNAENSAPTSSARYLNLKGVALKKGKQYTISLTASNAIVNRVYVAFFDEPEIAQNHSISTPTSFSFTSTTSAVYTFTASTNDYLYLWMGDVVGDFTIISAQVELGSTATAYEPYQGSQISVTFPSTAGTVYGGTLTVNPDRTGQLVVDRAIYTPIISNVISRDNASQATCGSIAPYNSIPYNAQDICTVAKYSASAYPGNFYGTGTNFVLFGDKSLDTKAKWEAYIAENNYQICYVLATPITYTLTASEIDGILETLYGTNNIWSDAGDVSVEYPCDTRLYIDNKITQAIAAALNA